MGGVTLFTDELHQFSVRHELMVHPDGEGLGVRFGIFDGDIDLHQAELHAAPALGHFAGIGGTAGGAT